MKTRRQLAVAGLLASAALISAPVALSHVGEKHPASRAGPFVKEQQQWGIAGEARAVTRTIPIIMTDDMRFQPDRIEVREGETIRFVHRNVGKVLHEMVIGTKPALDQHAALMRQFPGMEHDDPWMAHVAPGGEGEIVWTFNRAGTFDFACLIPGHYEAGMVGQIVVER